MNLQKKTEKKIIERNSRAGLCPTAAGMASLKFIFMKQMSPRKLVTLAAMSLLGLSFLTVGCERTVSKSEETKVSSDGTVKTKEKTVTESPDGTVTKKETKKTTSPEKP